MSDFSQAWPFLVAISLLVVGVVRQRRFLFGASLVVLMGACTLAFVTTGSSAAFSFVGGFVLVFGLVGVGLSRRLKPGGFVSRKGLGALGALLFFLGFAGMLML